MADVLGNQERSILRLDLGRITNEKGLVDELFESERFKNWETGDYPVYLLLDSLDECAIDFLKVSSILSNEIEKRKPLLSRLYLRIACRTIEWLSLIHI